ncbi:alanine racemase [Malaciobacter pacificus]|uniref:Alanine racemase n=1 Tax=Malaciobacter pacificus TaxID=1080223 RepID=A0A5C2H580_9BACT|nr:alanine racemase [Malaciobacter pacificus]QEP33963.1 alanine racemase [Malaciobacter pacificus]GGD35481.1 alanine racemase [Malaciobacter pacificus]
MALIKLNKNNLFYNLETISNHAGGKEKVAVVLKDNAYGHGLIEIATLASEFGIKKAVVRTLDEALAIEKLFDYILILAHKDFHTYSHTFHIALNSIEDIDNLPLGCNVHIKVDTGMHRNGILIEELEEAFLGLSKKNIKVTGIFTHHRNADNLSTDFFWQKSVFSRVKLAVSELCEKLSLDIPSFHSCNSAGLFRHTNFNEDFARVGIATYGYLDNANIFKFPTLKPVLSLWGKRISTRTLKESQSVGYGGTYKATEDTIISTYDVGYGDGFLRLNERKNYTTPDGFKVLGRVSMDNLSLNTNKDEVCIFNDANTLAKVHDTISYEITTTLSTNIKRVIV